MLNYISKPSIERIHIETEYEQRWLNNELVLERTNCLTGCWSETSNKQVFIRTKFTPDLQQRHDVNLIEFATELLKNFEASRVLLRWERKEIHTLQIHVIEKKFLYIEVIVKDQKWSFVFLIHEQTRNEIELWVNQIQKFISCEILSEDVNFEQIEFLPPAFGYFLHETLGHRLEGDDFQECIPWKNFKSCNFDVWDIPGNPGWLGYSPVDDMGTLCSSVHLFNGITGQQQLMSAETGNLRAINFTWHPIVRQRCLHVRYRFPEVPNYSKPTLLIGEIALGAFEGDSVTLFTNTQWLRDSQGNLFKLPPLVLKVSLDITYNFHAFGQTMIFHPGGGCHKGLQRGLGITFDCPSAWLPADTIEIVVDVQK